MHGPPELLDDHPGWAGGKLNATSILIEPLGPEECGTLVANLLADEGLDDAVRTRIAEAAEGHPLYAEEMTGLLVDEGRLVLKDGSMDRDDRSVRRPGPADDLGAPLRPAGQAADRRTAVIEIASVMGQVFYPSAVRALAGGDGIGTGITSLVRKQFVRPERSDVPGTEALAFRHLLLRDAAYDGISKATRAELHERFAEWLDAAGGSLGEQDEIVGYHLEQAYRYLLELGAAGERERQMADAAGRRLAAAGELAFARSDYAASVNLLSRASALLDPDDPLRLDILLDLGAALGSRRDGRRRSDIRRSDRASGAAEMSRCACTPSSSDG